MPGDVVAMIPGSEVRREKTKQRGDDGRAKREQKVGQGNRRSQERGAKLDAAITCFRHGNFSSG